MHTNDLHFSKFYPMQTKSQAHETLKSFMQEIGIPSELHSNDAKELTEGKCKIFWKNFGSKGAKVNHILPGKSELNCASENKMSC